jgi:hypothetical protein
MIMIELTLTIVSIVLGITTIVLTIRLRSRRSLAYKILSETQVLEVKEQVSQRIRVFYEDQKIKDLHLVLIGIVNDGNREIKKEDFVEPLALVFNSTAEIVDIKIEDRYPENLAVAYNKKAQNKLEIGLDLVNPRDWFILKILISKYSDFGVNARISGVGEIEEYRPPMSIVKRFSGLIFFGIILILIYMSAKVSRYLDLGTDLGKLLAVGAVIVGILVVPSLIDRLVSRIFRKPFQRGDNHFKLFQEEET